MKNLLGVPALLILLSAGGCTQTGPVATSQIYDPADSFQQYVQRSNKITLSAGNAQEVNTRLQEIDPWPKDVGNTRIAVDGQRMADAVYRYRCNKMAPQPLAIQGTGVTTASPSAASGSAGNADRPDSDCRGTTSSAAPLVNITNTGTPAPPQ